MMEQIIQGLNNAEMYLDNINTFTKTWEEHLILLKRSHVSKKQMALMSTPSNVYGLSKKPIAIDIG